MRLLESASLDLSIIMPCLNEENTVGICVKEAMTFLKKNKLKGEVIVVDNASEDDSAGVAKHCGAVVISEKRRGYGRAIRTGIAHSRGRVMIIGDCDTTYDFLHLDRFYQALAVEGYDMVIGDRLSVRAERGAMPVSHRLGVIFLSACARLRSKTDIRDFHCGLRGLTRQCTKRLTFTTDGMEFATEMILQAAARGQRIGQVPVVLRKCRYDRKSKLRAVSDGFRHLKYILLL